MKNYNEELSMAEYGRFFATEEKVKGRLVSISNNPLSAGYREVTKRLKFDFLTGGYGYLDLRRDAEINIAVGDMVNLYVFCRPDWDKHATDPMVMPSRREFSRLGLKTENVEGFVVLATSKAVVIDFPSLGRKGYYENDNSQLLKSLQQGSRVVCEVATDFLGVYFVYGFKELTVQGKNIVVFDQQVFDEGIARGSLVTDLNRGLGYVQTTVYMGNCRGLLFEALTFDVEPKVEDIILVRCTHINEGGHGAVGKVELILDED